MTHCIIEYECYCCKSVTYNYSLAEKLRGGMASCHRLSTRPYSTWAKPVVIGACNLDTVLHIQLDQIQVCAIASYYFCL